MSKRKVLIAIHQLNIGGAQKALISALNAIDYNENDVTLYVRKDRLDLLSQVNKNVSEIIINRDHTKYYRKPYSVMLLALLSLKKILKFDVTKTQNRLNDYVIRSKIRYEKKHYFSDDACYDIAVCYIQGYTAQSFVENVKAKKKILFYHDSTDSLHEIHSKIFKEFDKIYCVSSGAMQAVKGFYPQFADKIDYVENFVDYKRIRQDAEAFVPPYKEDRLTLCTCGRMTSVKGYDLAVKAAKILKDNGLSFEWYFVGDGVERAKIEQMILDNDLSDNINVTGIVDNPYAYIKNADIYVQPSYEESYGLAIVEAMMVGSVVVSTATVGGKAIIVDGKTGVVSDISAESLAEKIMMLVKDKYLQKKIKEKKKKNDYEEDYRIFCETWKKLLES